MLHLIMVEENKPLNASDSIIPVTKTNDVSVRSENYIYTLSILSDGLEGLYKIYDKWLYIEDRDRIDVLLGVALTHKAPEPKSMPIWLFLLGASGDMKTEQIKSLTSWKESKFLSMITPKTFVNGFPKVPDEVLKINGRLLITTDMAAMLNMNRDDKAEVWGQLRDLYDGYIHKSFGTGKTSSYSNIFFTWIAGSTPAIDEQIMIHQTLGTRELIYRVNEIKDKKALRDKIRVCASHEDEMKYELGKATMTFLEHKDYSIFELSQEIFDELAKQADYLCYMRALADCDPFSGELINKVYPEMPTRVLKQLIKIYNGLKSLDKDYPDEKALRIIKHIVKSSSSQFRIRIFEYALEPQNRHKEMTLSNIAGILKIGKKVVYRELNILWNMGLMNRRIEDVMAGYNKDIPTGREIYYFSLNLEHDFLKMLTGELDISMIRLKFQTCQSCGGTSPPLMLNKNGICDLCEESKYVD